MSKTTFDIYTETVTFSLMIMSLFEYLIHQKRFIVGRQLLSAATSIGANVREAKFASSKKDFTHKMRTALKEVNETEYWLYPCKQGGYVTTYKDFDAIHSKSKDLIAVLVKIVKTAKQNQASTS